MLKQHIRYSRGIEKQPLPDKQSIDSSDDGWSTLKDIDSEYYDKGIKKKTLAESFSSRNGADLEKRITKYKHLVEAKAKKYGLDPNLLAGLIRQESNFNPYAVSHCGAMGLGQIMPETARYLGVKDPFNAAQNLDASAKYLKEQLDNFGGDVNKALAAYNAGPGAVKKYGGIPPFTETQNYVRAIRSHRSQIAALSIFSSDNNKKA
ncbi:MAG: lytic transglycosylase domain-containing protein [Deltaproteobacteria bacterium]|nr:lytic transglycosylase domain-containing protein [Deltaproteobacteria bacterium]